MAIKGKKKPKSGGRRPTKTAPTPEIVVPKRPVWARPSVRLATVAVVTLLLGLGLGYGFGKQATADARAAEAAQLKKAYAQNQEQLDPVLATVGSAKGGTFDVLPELKSAIDSLKGNGGSPKAMEQLRTVSKDAKAASAALDQIDASKTGTGLPQQDVDDLVGAKQSMSDGLELMRQASRLAQRGDAASVNAAEDLAVAGTGIFQQGYQRFINSTTNAKVTLSSQNLQGPDLSEGLPGTLAPPGQPVDPNGLIPPGSQPVPQGSVPGQ